MSKLIPLSKDAVEEYRSIFWFPIVWGIECAQFSFNEVRDGTHDSPKESSEGFPLVTSKNLKVGIIDFNNTKTISARDHEEISRRSGVNEGDLLFSMIGTIGNVAIVPSDIEFSVKNVGLFRRNPNLLNIKYSFYWLLSETYQKYLDGKKRGGNQKFVSLGVLRESPVPIPPLAEQKQIATQLDQLLAQVDSLKNRLDSIPKILKRFRQSVLAAAVSGKLTEEWRGENETKDIVETIDEINKKKTGKLKVRKKNNWDKDLELMELPKNWAWIDNHKLATDSNTAICAGPFGTIFKAKDFRSEGVPIIFLRHVKEGGFNQRKPNYMDEEVWSEYHQEYSVYGGELLVTKLGDPPGESCIYPENAGISMVTPDVLKMNVDTNAADINYLKNFFNSPISKKMIGDAAFGVTRLRIDIAMFKVFPIPLAPREEQTEIVRRVEQLFTFADQIEQRVKDAHSRVNHLTQAILAKAFRGELTAQWRADNPDLITGENSAEALLARIKEEREKLVPKKKARKENT